MMMKNVSMKLKGLINKLNKIKLIQLINKKIQKNKKNNKIKYKIHKSKKQ